MAEVPAHPQAVLDTGLEGWPQYRVTTPHGDSVAIARQGAHVLSWRVQGRERLYLGVPPAPGSAMRGGVPVCWPQFNMRGPLVKHGFARNLPWRLGGVLQNGEATEVVFSLVSDDATRVLWPHDFELTLTVVMRPSRLRLTLDVLNPGQTPWSFTGALHTYFALADVSAARVLGLGGCAEWDALTDRHGVAPDALGFQGPFDRVYQASNQVLTISDAAGGFEIEQSPSWGHTVVWNPGQDMSDMRSGDFPQMLCVEAAQVMTPATVPARGRWQGWQDIRAL